MPWAALELPGQGGDRATAVFANRAGRLADLLGRHLADEEEIVIPALLNHGERAVM